MTLTLNVKTRVQKAKAVAQLRKADKIPAVLYGHKIKPLNLSIAYSDFEKLYRQAGESTLVDLIVDDGKPVKVLIQDYQLEPKTNRFIHVDFHQVRMDEKIHTEIGLKFIGEAPVIKEKGGMMVTNIHAVEVTCLPQDLVHEIEVNISGLKTFDDAIHVADIIVPKGITILNVPNDVVVLIQAPRTEKELADLESKPEVKAPIETEAVAEGGESEKSE
ncbi:MAG: 50S ribosomal protein L25 [Patescibacteria group bacterium]